ncbi:MAG: cytochrome C oxidase subunit IV family protein [Bdellovibrionales bacterium]
MLQDPHEHHIIPLSSYVKVLALLLVLTAITVAAAQVNFGPWNTVIAMAIASVKAGFVLAIFMHLKYDNKLFVVCFCTAVFFLVVLYFFTNLDILTRVHVDSIL